MVSSQKCFVGGQKTEQLQRISFLTLGYKCSFASMFALNRRLFLRTKFQRPLRSRERSKVKGGVGVYKYKRSGRIPSFIRSYS